MGYAVSGGAAHERMALDVDETGTHFVDVYVGIVNFKPSRYELL